MMFPEAAIDGAVATIRKQRQRIESDRVQFPLEPL